MDYLEGCKSSYKLFLLSCLGAAFIAYPNFVWLPCQLTHLLETTNREYLVFFVFRFFYFAFLLWLLARMNLGNPALNFRVRLFRNFLVTTLAYGIYFLVSMIPSVKMDFIGSFLVFQFLVIGVTCTLLGHLLRLSYEQRKKEVEIERLRTENLQSRCDALANQINPHFFFNSLNSLSALVRRKDEHVTLEFINKLSDVFRYILQSDKKGLVTLDEELEFVHAFSYMMKVRFANKLEFSIEVNASDSKRRLPVLSLLPLIDNVVVHNRIDSEHPMFVSILMNERKELVVSNPIYPKLHPSETNGTGLRNLMNRFDLLMHRQVRIEDDGEYFRVYLPLS